ncbi:MAG: dihydrofolate reductase [Nocardioidaceae bacterium]
MTVSLIAALGRNRVIGSDGDLPWHLSEDLKRLKRLTMGHTLVMGRLTYESIGRPLPGRTTIVVTRQRGWAADGVTVAHSLTEALAVALAGDDDVFVMGGGEIYAQALPLADRLELTEVDQAPAGDTYFPVVAADDWEESAREQREGFTWVTYERATGSSGAAASVGGPL